MTLQALQGTVDTQETVASADTAGTRGIEEGVSKYDTADIEDIVDILVGLDTGILVDTPAHFGQCRGPGHCSHWEGPQHCSRPRQV